MAALSFRPKGTGAVWAAGILFTIVLVFAQEAPEAASAGLSREFPAELLRGYGKISGTFLGEPGKSLLELTCESEEKAALAQAKYLSDLGVLPGVAAGDLSLGDSGISAWKVEGQGMIAAVRSGARVFIGAAETETGLAAVLKEKLGAKVQREDSIASVEVPMWLNRWDKYGFRFYYRAWELPPGAKAYADYDFSKEFEFAEKMDRSGLIFWANTEDLDTAEGLTNEAWWNWALRSTAAKKLPVGLNISTGTPGRGWFFNRYRDQTMAKMPQFTGNYHMVANPYFGGSGALSWNATTAKDAELGILQGIVARALENPNVTSVLEPHGELRHGAQDIFVEYGPVADATFQTFLKDRYKTVEALNAAWGSKFADWSGVRVPEVASFLGWGPQALDLAGIWRVGYEKTKNEAHRDEQGSRRFDSMSSEPAPEEWFSERFNDSQWPFVTAPGHDRTSLLIQRPAVYRRNFQVPPAWLRKTPRVWLYVWDLNTAGDDSVKVVLNGKKVGENRLERAFPHWGAYDVTNVLRPGNNQLSLRLPKGILAYRVYLSPDEPRQYPNLGKAGNARWVDFSDWIVWSRLEMVRRGMEMIRQVDGNRQITLMAPDGYEDGVKKLAIAYGGNFHNTGYMGAFWADAHPAHMRGARLPFSLEPGGPAGDLKEFKKHIGLYSTEGLQGIDYFIHLGNIFWNPDIKKFFEENLRLIRLIGKYHAPPAEVAALYSTRGDALTGYPWGADINTNLGAGYWEWNVRAYLRERFESDALSESSFESGDAARYRVIIDSNTSIMDESTVAAIERYVQDGGTFVTFVQTGRHTPVEKDAWPISRLTGYRVTRIDPLNPDGIPAASRTLKPAPDQNVFSGDWSQVRANGLTLEKIAPDTRNLMLWEDGSVAIGMRPLGKGFIVQVGCKFAGRKINDRVEPPNNQARPTFDSRPAESKSLTRLFEQILAWRKIPPVDGKLEPENENVILRHYLSNNGLYDVWVLWNQSPSSPADETVVMRGAAASGWDVIAGKPLSFPAGRLPVKLDPYQTRAFLTPRNEIARASAEWFALQRDWWRQPKAVDAPALPRPEHRFSVDLGSDWAFKPLKDGEDGAAYAAIGTDDSTWEKVDLGVWSLPDKKDVRRAVLRRTFEVPAAWTDGTPTLSVQSWLGSTFVDAGRVWLDGKLIEDWREAGLIDANPGGVLTPGSKHVVTLEIKGKGSLNGTRGPAWLWFWPRPDSSIDLAGDWTPSRDALVQGTPVRLPGRYDAMTLRREIVIPADKASKNVILRVKTTGRLVGVNINGHWVRRFHHIIGERFDLNITPWVKFGQPNEVELASMDGPASGTLSEVFLDFHNKDSYP